MPKIEESPLKGPKKGYPYFRKQPLVSVGELQTQLYCFWKVFYMKHSVSSQDNSPFNSVSPPRYRWLVDVGLWARKRLADQKAHCLHLLLELNQQIRRLRG